jgi:hypothetical protein
MQRASHGSSGGSPLILVFGVRGAMMTLTGRDACGGPRRAVLIGFACVLAATAVWPRIVVGTSGAPIEECEAALGNLITTLESKKQLEGTQYLYSGAPLGSDYSKCRVSGRKASSPRYAVYRASDNINVVIEKRPTSTAGPALYGPFASAYRK